MHPLEELGVNTKSVQMPDGSLKSVSYLRHPGTVIALVEPSAGSLVITSQFRPILGIKTAELPGGVVEADELPHAAIVREVAEETGIIVSEPVAVAKFYLSVGTSDELVTLFRTRFISYGQPRTAPDEYDLTFSLRTAAELHESVKAGTLVDAKTLIGVTYWLAARGDGDGDRDNPSAS